MTDMTDKVKGTANEAIGAVKQSVGKALGNPDLAVEGVAQKLKGQAQQVIGETSETLKTFVDKKI